jgi:hypothetical protein
MTGGSRTTFYRDNHNEDNNKKYNRKTIAIIIFIGALLSAKLYFLWFWPGELNNYFYHYYMLLFCI